jgi:hypothetical protein
MKKIIIALFLGIFTSLTNTYAQIPVGNKIDINGISLHNYFDPLAYAPTKKLSITIAYNS